MRRIMILIGCLVCSVTLWAQQKMYIHQSNHISLGTSFSESDSIYFNTDGTQVFFGTGGNTSAYQVSSVDSISFGDDSNTVAINYNGNFASVINPFAFDGVAVSVTGADVVVTSTNETRDINYQLSGTSSDGMFKIYSAKRFNLKMNGVNLTNADGPAINVQASKKVSVELVDGTMNTLADGATYAAALLDSEGEEEDQKAVFFSEGQVIFSGDGSLTINGKATDKHALCSDGYVKVDGGNITISGAAKDGIHGKDGVAITGGTIHVKATGDGIDGDEGFVLITGGSTTVICSSADVNGISCDSIFTVSGGEINVTMNGNQSKALRANQNMTFTGGDITLKTTGGVALVASGSGYDPAYCAAIKGDSIVTIDGATIIINSTGVAGRGISAPIINMTSGTVNITTTGAGATYKNSTGVTDAYRAVALKSDGDIRILGGNLTTYCSGSAGKGIATDGTLTFGDSSHSPIINVTTTGSKITISSSSGGGGGGFGGPSGSTGDYAEAKAISCEGAVVINSGSITISSADDGIKSKTSISIANAVVSITKAVEGMEAPNITVNSGEVSILASDDGFNATNGSGGESNDGSSLNLNGGTIYVNTTTGDGLDSNGNIVITGGTIVVHGPQSSPEVGIDYNGTCNISGGFLVVSGTNSNMTQATSTSSSQYCIKATTSSSVAAGTLFRIQDSSGTNLVTFKPTRSFYSVIFSSPDLKSGSSYSIYTGGTSTGANVNGLYSGGTYNGGTQKKSFTVSSKVTSVSF